MHNTHSPWVAKFGGTSVANLTAMQRCIQIIGDHPTIRMVVVSAPGGITNLLINIIDARKKGFDYASDLQNIKDRVYSFLDSNLLKSNFSPIESLLHELSTLVQQNMFQKGIEDEILAYGERFSAYIFTALLETQGHKTQYVDARNWLKTSDQYGKAEVLIAETKKRVSEYIATQSEKSIIVTEGFIGSTLNDATTTLGRGGSDYSAAILAEAAQAEVLQIWTDVPGIYTVDPKLAQHAQPIEFISFAEAAELATFGAKILHPATLWPAIRKNIPVFVGSSLNAKTKGTWIKQNYPDHLTAPPLSAIAVRTGQCLLTITSLDMLHAYGFIAKVFAILATHQLSVDLVTTSEVSIALTFNNVDASLAALLDGQSEVLKQLRAIGNVSLQVDTGLSLIALVGNHMHVTPGISGQVFHILRGFNVRLICHGASQHNLCFLVSEEDTQKVVSAMHAHFFEKNLD